MITSAIFPLKERYINDFDAYRIYNILRLHFNTRYDAIKYNFKNKTVTWDTYQKVTELEVKAYHRWSKEYCTEQDLYMALAGTFFYLKPTYLMQYSPTDDVVKQIYARVKQFMLSPTYFVTNDLTYLNNNYTISVIKTVNGNIPKIYPLAMKDFIRVESLAVIDTCTGLTTFTDKTLNSFTWMAFKESYLKFRPLICQTVDDKMKTIITQQITTIKRK